MCPPAEKRFLLDLQAIAAGSPVPYATLRSWAQREGWTKHGQRSRRVQYDVREVLASMNRHLGEGWQQRLADEDRDRDPYGDDLF